MTDECVISVLEISRASCELNVGFMEVGPGEKVFHTDEACKVWIYFIFCFDVSEGKSIGKKLSFGLKIPLGPPT